MILMSSALLLLSSCEKQRLENREEKLVGTWYFETVKKGSGFNLNDVSYRWSMYEVTFLEGGSMKWYNTETLEQQTGFWRLDYDNEYYYLEISLVDSAYNITYYDWQISALTRSKLNVYEQYEKNKDNMRYKLRKF